MTQLEERYKGNMSFRIVVSVRQFAYGYTCVMICMRQGTLGNLNTEGDIEAINKFFEVSLSRL